MKVTPKSHQQGDESHTTYTRQFSFQGKRYRLFKRDETKDAAYYVDFVHRKERFKKSLETNVAETAEYRAKIFIGKVRAGKWQEADGLKARQEAPPTLKDIFDLYDKFALIGSRAKHKNRLSMLSMIRRVHGDIADTPEEVTLDLINESLVHRYQETFVREYQQKAGPDEASQREARERGLRSSRSFVQQARSLFSPMKDLPIKYATAGFPLPDSVQSFMAARLQGKLSKAEYNPPPDETVEKAFVKIEELKTTEPDVYLAFWLAAGAGLRRGEIQALQWRHVIERNGSWWISGGIGKNGDQIEVPIQDRAVEALRPFRKEEGFVLTQRGLWWAKQLNWWMRFNGWDTEKKMHELRAYVGSLLYRKDPVAAKMFMRHSSFKQTEAFYVRYAKAPIPTDVL